MSKKILCACDEEVSKDRPLVITITTCPKKKHHPHISTIKSVPKKPTTTTDQPGDYSKSKPTGTEGPSDHLLICDDEGTTIPLKNAERPLIDNSAYVDLDKEDRTPSADKSKRDVEKPESILIKKEPEDDGTYGLPSRPGKSVSPSEESPKSDSSVIFIDTPSLRSSKTNENNKLEDVQKHDSIIDLTTDSLPDNTPSKTSKDAVSVSEPDKLSDQNDTTADKSSKKKKKDTKEKKPSKSKVKKKDSAVDEAVSDTSPDKSKKKKKDKKEKKTPTKPSDLKEPKKEPVEDEPLENDKTVVPSSKKKEAINNFPSDAQIKLPIIIPRYHGPGCAMEVDILEKHERDCKYKKLKNPERNPADDRTGSYEVIGRLLFKTCHPEPQLDHQNPTEVAKSEHTKVSTIYSLFGIPHKFSEIPFDPTLSEKEQKIETYMRRKKLLEQLVRSSKSFPNQSTGYTEENKKTVNLKESKDVSDLYQSSKVTSCDVEVLYFYGRRNKAVQFSDNREHRKRKWFYFILPCVAANESHSTIED